ncbi:peptidylprolyl isomerase [Paracoccus sp. (in: a-proteobacteria)]|uniref:peptidylprolyl isomerase n=1 Tax=Paracoccus sp. TaxID=267 RepID=UPI0026E0B986|nr:peptidylprolyl isomerase [Paracoccus sp. (in: a-proteobacteria)]MDO5648411.1 peptidylprolyl isomerase [Paracoccus sp. (in: a-proteobacteria)]
MLRSSFLAAALAAPLLLPGVAGAQDADTVVATVNGQDITLGQMIVMRQSLADPNVDGMPDAALWDMMLDQLIRQTAVASAGVENAGVRAQLELQRRNTLATAAVSRLADVEPSDDEIRETYDRLMGDVGGATEYNAAHILVDSPEKAAEVRAELDAGADFGELAEAYSTGPSGPNRGDLGWFTADQMVTPFADAVMAMQPGQISDPVQTDFGWHIIQLNDTRMQEAPPLADVRDQIAQLVRRTKVEDDIERLVHEADVTRDDSINPALMNNLTLLEAE